MRCDRPTYFAFAIVPFLIESGIETWVVRGGSAAPVVLAPLLVAALVVLSVQRVRDAGLHPAIGVVAAIPFLRAPLMTILLALPAHGEKADEEKEEAEPPLAPIIEGMVPASNAGRRLLALGGSLVIPILAFLVVCVAPRSGEVPLAPLFPTGEVLGAGLFVGVPFLMGLWASFVESYRRERPEIGAVGMASLVYAITSMAFLALAFEGIACIVMATPIVLPLMTLGAWVGQLLGRARRTRAAAFLALAALLLLAKDAVLPPEPVRFERQVAVTVRAKRERVFEYAAAIPPVREAPGPLHAILAVHRESRLEGRGVGARRKCVYTVGDIEETVVGWEEGRAIDFRVDRAPKAVTRCIRPEEGRFVLEENADGTTTVTATARYAVKLAPAAYWGVWTQHMVGTILRRGLEEVKRSAEETTPPVRVEQLARLPEVPRWMALANSTCACTRHAEGR